MVDLAPAALAALAFLMAAVGALGGIGGAVLLVPTLVLLGVEPAEAAPLGLLTVAAGSLAASSGQLRSGLVHHRLGVLVEITASAGALVGALVSGAVSESALRIVLALTAIAAGLAGWYRKGLRNPPDATFVAEVPGEWPGTLAGAYQYDADQLVPYRARRIPAGLAGMSVAGVLSGISGVGGGFVKTPLLSEVMGVPVKVAAATSTFTVGITASTALLVFAGQGRLDVDAGAAVVAGALIGGLAGAQVQRTIPPVTARRVVATLLCIVGLVLLVTG
jgi:hypothetical protein